MTQENLMQPIAGVARSAMLVDLFISTYSGRKQDRKTQDEVTTSKGAASKKAATVAKHLFADCKELDDITKFQSRARALHYKLTLPWSDNGSRLLPMTKFMEYKQVMNDAEDEFRRLVMKFVSVYDTRVAAAAFQLGTLFNRSEYLTQAQVARRFSFEISFTPLPLSGDFRLDADLEVQRDLIESYEAKANARLQASMQDAWKRLHEVLLRISDRLGPTEDGKPKIFHETMLSNADELVELLRDFNVTGDPAMERARVALREAVLGVSAKELRTTEAVRVDVKQKVDEILGQFDWFSDEEEE